MPRAVIGCWRVTTRPPRRTGPGPRSASQALATAPSRSSAGRKNETTCRRASSDSTANGSPTLLAAPASARRVPGRLSRRIDVALEVLGIAPTAEVSAIRKAYAARLNRRAPRTIPLASPGCARPMRQRCRWRPGSRRLTATPAGGEATGTETGNACPRPRRGPKRRSSRPSCPHCRARPCRSPQSSCPFGRPTRRARPGETRPDIGHGADGTAAGRGRRPRGTSSMR